MCVLNLVQLQPIYSNYQHVLSQHTHADCGIESFEHAQEAAGSCMHHSWKVVTVSHIQPESNMATGRTYPALAFKELSKASKSGELVIAIFDS